MSVGITETLTFLQTNSGQRLFLSPETATGLGRADDNDVVFEDRTVSAHHARISYSSGSFRVHDLESKNHTLLDGRRISDAVLKNGSILTIGGTELAFRQEPLAPARLVELQLLGVDQSSYLPVDVLQDVISDLKGMGERGRAIAFDFLTSIALSKGLANESDFALIYGLSVLSQARRAERLTLVRKLLPSEQRRLDFRGPLPTFVHDNTKYWFLLRALDLGDAANNTRGNELLGRFATSIGIPPTAWERLRAGMGHLSAQEVGAVVKIPVAFLLATGKTGAKIKAGLAATDIEGVFSSVDKLRLAGPEIRSSQQIRRRLFSKRLRIARFEPEAALSQNVLLSLQLMFGRALRLDIEALQRRHWSDVLRPRTVKFRREAYNQLIALGV